MARIEQEQIVKIVEWVGSVTKIVHVQVHFTEDADIPESWMINPVMRYICSCDLEGEKDV